MKASIHSLLHRLLEEQAPKTPENGALEFYPTVPFTYRELNEISNRVACYLKDHQAMSREIVAICVEKTHKLVIAILAVLKAGMAWGPLPLDAHPTRIEQLIRSCDVGLFSALSQIAILWAIWRPVSSLTRYWRAPSCNPIPGAILMLSVELRRTCAISCSHRLQPGLPKE